MSSIIRKRRKNRRIEGIKLLRHLLTVQERAIESGHTEVQLAYWRVSSAANTGGVFAAVASDKTDNNLLHGVLILIDFSLQEVSIRRTVLNRFKPLELEEAVVALVEVFNDLFADTNA